MSELGKSEQTELSKYARNLEDKLAKCEQKLKKIKKGLRTCSIGCKKCGIQNFCQTYKIKKIIEE